MHCHREKEMASTREGYVRKTRQDKKSPDYVFVLDGYCMHNGSLIPHLDITKRNGVSCGACLAWLGRLVLRF